MPHKGTVRKVPIDFADNKLERRVLFIKHLELPKEGRPEFKDWASKYIMALIVNDLSSDVEALIEEDAAAATAASNRGLEKFTNEQINAYLASKRAAASDIAE